MSSLLLVGSTLLTVSQRDAAWSLTLYTSSTQSACSGFQTLTSFSLPPASGLLLSDGAARKSRRPVLVCVRSSDAAPALSDGHFRLQPTLFKLLFGIDAALAKSPVVLCGLPDGRLYHLPLHLSTSRLRILHSLEQPLVFIGSFAAEETDAGDASALVAVGDMGRVLLIRTQTAAPGKEERSAAFTDTCVPGPVMCGCTHGNFLYYSTGSDLLRLDLSAVSIRKDDPDNYIGTNSRDSDSFLQSPVSLNVCRVVALAEASSTAAGEQRQARHQSGVCLEMFFLVCRMWK